MFHKISFYGFQKTAILYLLNRIIEAFSKAQQKDASPSLKRAIGIPYELEQPPHDFYVKVLRLRDTLERDGRTMNHAILINDEEFETLASAYTFCEMCLMNDSWDGEASMTTVRQLLQAKDRF